MKEDPNDTRAWTARELARALPFDVEAIKLGHDPDRVEIDAIWRQRLIDLALAEAWINEHQHRTLRLHLGIDGDPMTTGEVGALLGVGRTRVDQIVARARRGIRDGVERAVARRWAERQVRWEEDHGWLERALAQLRRWPGG